VRPTQPVEIFGIVSRFYAILYLCHPLTFVENFTEIVPGNHFVQLLGVKVARGVARYSDFGFVEGYIGNGTNGLGYN